MKKNLDFNMINKYKLIILNKSQKSKNNNLNSKFIK